MPEICVPTNPIPKSESQGTFPVLEDCIALNPNSKTLRPISLDLFQAVVTCERLQNPIAQEFVKMVKN